MPVDCYVGGAEHSVLHLLYARFWHKVLFDIGLLPSPEPFQKLRHQGMILSTSHRDSRGVYHPYESVRHNDAGKAAHAETGEELSTQVEKMSKSKKNVVNPDPILKQYGADTFRLYEMFMGPLELAKPWDMASIGGMARFLRRVHALVSEADPEDGEGLVATRHKTIQKVTEDIEAMAFNTAISALMIYSNEISSARRSRADMETLLSLLNPFAPHLTEELWERLGHRTCLSSAPWPSFDAAHTKETSVEYAVQVNGKVRATFSFRADAPQGEVAAAALALEKVKGAIDGKHLVKTIVIPNRLVSLVVK